MVDHSMTINPLLSFDSPLKIGLCHLRSDQKNPMRFPGYPLRTNLGYEEGPSLFLNAVHRQLDGPRWELPGFLEDHPRERNPIPLW